MHHHKGSARFITFVNELLGKIPFNSLIGLRMESITSDCVKTVFEMRDELVGNYKLRMLHGGVISTAIDATGGIAAVLTLQEKMPGENEEVKIEKSFKISTLDLHVDFLRPGLGERFVVSAYVLRTGNKIAVTRMELHNDRNELIAVGTGAYFFAK